MSQIKAELAEADAREIAITALHDEMEDAVDYGLIDARLASDLLVLAALSPVNFLNYVTSEVTDE